MIKFKAFTFTLLIITCLITSINSQSVGEECTRKYDNARGICRNHRDCRKVRDDYNRGIAITYCDFIGSSAVVCCPENVDFVENNNHLPSSRISAEKCKEYGELTYEKFTVWGLLLNQGDSSKAPSISVPKCNPTTPLIVGGKPTGKGEFPHMAAIGWRRARGKLTFDCGGSLISERHVLTAAHCESSDNVLPSFVRLGDHNIYSKDDNMNEVDIDIADFIKHPQYSTRTLKNDVAIIKMARSVEFTDNIRPACLWQGMNLNISKVVATGYGYTGYASPQSEELLKVELDVIDQDQCNDLLEEKLSLTREKLIDSSQICAGVLRGGRDTCGGDSGGPLQVTLSGNQCLYHIVAITSFGGVFCGFPLTPAVYSRVSAFLDFIEDNVWRN